MILSVFITVISGHDKPQPPGCLLGRRAQPVSEPADTGRTVPGGVDYISGQDQKWWPAAAGIAAYGSNHAGFTVWLKVIFLLNIVR